MMRVLGAALAVFVSASAPAGAQERNVAPPGQAAAGTPEQPHWRASCATGSREDTLDCAIEQRLFLAETGQLVAAVTVRVPADTRSPVMMIQVPLGLYLPSGVKLGIDGGAEEMMPLQTCDASGCYAGGPLSAEMLDALKRGDTLAVIFENLQRQPVTVPVQLAGFAAAYTKIQ